MRLLAMALVSVLALASAGLPLAAAGAGPGLRGQVIVVDAGHGGNDNGALVAGLDEKVIDLAISRKTARALRQAGSKVIETRTTDANLIPQQSKPTNLQRLTLQARVDLAVQHGAGIFLSIHANKFSDASAHGAQIFIGEKPDAERRLLGTCLHAEFTSLSGSKRQLDMETDLYLMRNLRIPAALIEVGFMSNPNDRNKMLNPTYQRDIAQAITRGVACFVRGRPALQIHHHTPQAVESAD